MIQVQILAVENMTAILAGVPVALKNIVPGEFDLLLWQPVEHDQQDDARHADFEGDGMDAFGMRFLPGKIMPLVEVEGLKCPVAAVKDDMGMAFKKQSKSAAGRADVDGLPESVQHQNVLRQIGTHTTATRGTYHKQNHSVNRSV